MRKLILSLLLGCVAASAQTIPNIAPNQTINPGDCVVWVTKTTIGGSQVNCPTIGNGPMIYSGVWDSTVSYAIGNTVIYNGTYYTALLSSINTIPVNNPGAWQVLGFTVGGFSADLTSPSTADSGIFQIKFPRDIRFNRVSCSTDQGTVEINLDVRSETTPNTAGTLVLLNPLVCTSGTASTASFYTTTVLANSPLGIMVNNVTGAPQVLRLHVATQ